MSAQVQPEIKSGKITLDNFVKGLAPLAGAFTDPNTHNYSDKDHFSSYTAGINPYRFINCIAPAAQKVVGVNTNLITDIPKNFVTRLQSDLVTIEGYMIGAGDGATGGSVKLYQVSNGGSTLSTIVNGGTPSFPHSVVNAKRGYDLKIVTLAGIDYVVYSWDDQATANPTRKLGIWNFSDTFTTSNKADDAWSGLSSATNDTPSFLAIEQGADGNYYISSGYKLDKLTSASAPASAFSQNAVALPQNYIALTMRDYKGTMVIGGTERRCVGNKTINGVSKVFFWDYVNSTFTNIVDIQDNYLSCLFVKDGDLYAFTGTRNGYSKLRRFTGQEFETVCEFLGNPPDHNNVDVYKNILVWVANGQIMSYGRPDSNFPLAYNILDNSGITGFVKCLLTTSGYDFHFSTSSQLTRVYGSGFDSSSIYSSAFVHLPRKSTVYAVKFYFNQLAAGATATCEYVVNKGGTPKAFSANSGVISFAQNGAITEYTFSQNIMDVDDFLIYINFPTGSSSNCVAFNRIEIYYAETNKL